MQYGKTPLIYACSNEDEVSAALLMEATKEAGALDVQVTEQAWVGVSGVRGAGRYSGGKEGPGYQRILVLTCTCTCLYTG